MFPLDYLHTRIGDPMISDVDGKFDIDIPDDKIIESFYDSNPNIKKTFKIKKLKFALKFEQRVELLAAAEKHFKPHSLMIKSQMMTGMRVGEMVNLLDENVNFGEGYIRIESNEDDADDENRVESWTPKTTSSQRLIPLEQGLARELMKYIDDRYINLKKAGKEKEASPYLFVTRLGTKYNRISVINFINKYAKECSSIGHTIGSHAMRRTFASFLIKKGVPVDKISKYLGHSSVSTTMKYLFEISDMSEMEKDAKILSGMFSN